MVQIRVNNLPPGVTEDEVRNLFDNLDEIEAIRLTDAGNPENVVAWVEVKLSRVQADAIVEKLNGRRWKDRPLQVYAALYLK